MVNTKESPGQHKLNTIAATSIPAALEKAQQYGELGLTAEAENICQDILAYNDTVDEAREFLLLALIDKFEQGPANLVALWIYCPDLRAIISSLAK